VIEPMCSGSVLPAVIHCESSVHEGARSVHLMHNVAVCWEYGFVDTNSIEFLRIQSIILLICLLSVNIHRYV